MTLAALDKTILPLASSNRVSRLSRRWGPPALSQGSQKLYEGPKLESLWWIAKFLAGNINFFSGVVCCGSGRWSSNAYTITLPSTGTALSSFPLAKNMIRPPKPRTADLPGWFSVVSVQTASTRSGVCGLGSDSRIASDSSRFHLAHPGAARRAADHSRKTLRLFRVGRFRLSVIG